MHGVGTQIERDVEEGEYCHTPARPCIPSRGKWSNFLKALTLLKAQTVRDDTGAIMATLLYRVKRQNDTQAYHSIVSAVGYDGII